MTTIFFILILNLPDVFLEEAKFIENKSFHEKFEWNLSNLNQATFLQNVDFYMHTFELKSR